MSDCIRLRPATSQDAPKLWQWRNEAETRAASFHPEPIVYDDHERWLGAKMSDPNSFFLIAIGEGESEIGYVRLDIIGEAVEVNLSLDRAYRGRGLGAGTILAATEFAVTKLKMQRVVARVKSDNAVSLHAFRAAGFVRKDVQDIHGAQAAELVWEDREWGVGA